MANGGFSIKFDGKKTERCFSCSFDCDKWEYTLNEREVKPLPKKLKR